MSSLETSPALPPLPIKNTVLFPLYPWSDLRFPTAEPPSTLAGWIPFLLIVSAFALRMRRGMLAGTIYSYVWLPLSLNPWEAR